jgi:hypothetical protein
MGAFFNYGIVHALLASMTTKTTSITNKQWSNVESIGFSPAWLITKLMNFISINVPVGYQDETGFHTGVKSAQKATKWPTPW